MKTTTDTIDTQSLAIVADCIRKLFPDINTGSMWLQSTDTYERCFFHHDWQFGDDGIAYFDLA